MMMNFPVLAIYLLVSAGPAADADTSHGDRLLADYFRRETEKLNRRTRAVLDSHERWLENRALYRRQLFEMLGLDPLPAKSDLRATVTGKHPAPRSPARRCPPGWPPAPPASSGRR